MSDKLAVERLRALDEADINRFWANVDKEPGHGPEGDCWKWTGTTRHYDLRAQFYWNKKTRNAARFALEMKIGRPLGTRMCACHTCDNPTCVNPDHLWEGTYKQNVQDARAKLRMCGMRITHCRKGGHPLSGDNLYLRKDGRRVCRECIKQNIIRHRAGKSSRKGSHP